MVLLEILFVRHGLSCANAWARTSKAFEAMYPDPELTTYGITRSVEKGPVLAALVDELFPDGRYSLGASCMIRAQQTAYYMLARATGKPIHILPHIGELSPGSCNFPLGPAEQREILGPEIVAHLGTDARGDVGWYGRADLDKFLAWAHDAPEPFFTPATNAAGEAVHRAVIVTHSLFLNHVFKHMLNNNDVLFAKIDTGSKSILEQRRLTTMDDLPEAEDVKVDGCRIASAGTLTGTGVQSICRGLGSLGSSAVSGLWSRFTGSGRKRSGKRRSLRKRTRRQRR
jgi:broad specificity phosphatase PhoE